ncbi:unnamed protein product [Brachionus calyciflorus]|uniref:Tc1-like transposase DDE domain-containing protein n=1 Tax=Brachionus calyciflorus TaxID=104777 RepID=A0A814ALR6_9BILA|nr:unnamed protein product [Brachionus calyciflorus]
MGKKSVSSPLKWQIIGLLKSGDKKQNAIAKLLGVSPKCVSSTKKRYEETGTVSDRSRSGLESHTAVRKPLLTIKDRQKRYKWCKQRLNWTINDWSRVIFSDESNFEVFNRNSRVIVKRFKNEKFHPKFCIPRLQNGGGSAGIWGCISYKGTGISNIYTGRINQFVYINTLENNLLPSVELLFEQNDPWIFQQDGASAHTAHLVSDWFKEQNIEVLPWCARSPDLNPIENLWSYMDAKMVNTKVTSIEHLKEVLHKEWLKIPTEYVKKLIESMPKRVLVCYKAKGGHFKY